MCCCPYSDFSSGPFSHNGPRTLDQTSYFFPKRKFGLELLLVVLLFPSQRKERDKESVIGGRGQPRIPYMLSLQVVAVLTKNSSQYSLVKKKICQLLSSRCRTIQYLTSGMNEPV